MSQSVFDRSTVDLIHYGRKSGQPYRVKIWFAVVDGKVWIGSLSRERSWVRNLRASGRAELDFASETRPVCARYSEDERDVGRFAEAIRRKHPVASRILTLFMRGKRCAFETDLVV
jgi:deazaflavin-dependent oxidoreductase (nitroreductase family)